MEKRKDFDIKEWKKWESNKKVTTEIFHIAKFEAHQSETCMRTRMESLRTRLPFGTS